MITSVCMFWFIYLFLNPAFNQSIVFFSVSKVLGGMIFVGIFIT